MENLNKKNTEQNQELNTQKNASATKNNLLKWVVIENFQHKDFIMCSVYEHGEYQYRVSVIKNDKIKNVVCGQVIKDCIVEYNYISPDGFPISYENFPCKKVAQDFFRSWIKSFERQGYYSSAKYDRIPLNMLKDFCEFKRFLIDVQDENYEQSNIIL